MKQAADYLASASGPFWLLVSLGGAALFVLLTWAWHNWVKVWYDCTTDYKSGHYVQKDVLRFLAGLGAVAYFLLVYPAVHILFQIELSTLPGFALAAMASLLNWQKIKQVAELDRRTKDPQGGALTIPANQAAPDQDAPLPLQNQGDDNPPPAPD